MYEEMAALSEPLGSLKFAIACKISLSNLQTTTKKEALNRAAKQKVNHNRDNILQYDTICQ